MVQPEGARQGEEGGSGTGSRVDKVGERKEACTLLPVCPYNVNVCQQLVQAHFTGNIGRPTESIMLKVGFYITKGNHEDKTGQRKDSPITRSPTGGVVPFQ